MKFQNVQVGDGVMLLKTLAVYTKGFSLRGFTHFKKSFYIKNKVIKVTKTQFTIDGGLRFTKDGCGYGDNNSQVFVAGERIPNLLSVGVEFAPTESQLAEYKEYEIIVNALQPYAYTPDEYNPINAKTIEQAMEALSTLNELTRIIGYKKGTK